MERSQPQEAVQHLRAGISIDPLRESMQRALMEALAAGELTMSGVDASVLRMAAVKGPNPRCGR